MTGGLSRAEVEALAAPLGVTPRTLENYAREGLIAGPVCTGRGRGHGVEFRWPPEVATQLPALAEAQKYTHSWVGLRHWLWWEGHPIDFERWRADRMSEMLELPETHQWARDLSEAGREQATLALAQQLGNRRAVPYRRQELRTPDLQELLASLTMRALAGQELPNLADPDDDMGATIGAFLDRGLATPALRASGATASEEPGQRILDVIVKAATLMDQIPRRLELLTEVEALKARDILTAEDALDPRLPGRWLRDQPALAATLLVLFQGATRRS